MTKSTIVTKILGTAAVLVAALPLTGCLFGGATNVHESGRYVSEETLTRITPGMEPGSVQALLGTPSSKVELPGEEKEIWRYSYERSVTSKGKILFLMRTESRSDRSGSVFVEFADGQVIKTWRD